jgi:aflatoxin B1 aldehyde reductase
LGNAGAGDGRFAISTKCAGGWRAGIALLPENLYRDAHKSLEKLKVKQIDIFYIHAPDRTLKPEDWVPTIHKLYEEGVFKRFGISNFSPEEVKELHAYSEKNNFVQATVYQGNYSAIARNPEKVLFPTLRSRNIAFYAYSPLAGGFLTKTREQLTEGVGSGRWAKNSPMTMYRDM